MNLLIVESPSKSAKIQKWLGPGWIVAASFGHVRDLPLKDLGVSIPGFNPTYVVLESKTANVAKLRQHAARANQIYLATDPDREGEAISWHLMKVLSIASPLRVTFQEVTEKAVKDAVANPRAINMRLVAAQEARRVLDRLVGFKASPIACSILNDKASAGRVQTPCVRLICDREDAIDAFRETKHFGARLWFGGNQWSAEWQTAKWLPQGSQYLLDKTLAARAAAVRSLSVVSSTTKPALRQPQAPFNTSTLLQAASSALGLATATTQQAAQKLFEGGHITYHRTDSVNLSDDTVSELCAYADKAGLPLAPRPRKWPSKDGAQEAHEAIRPTHWDVEQAGDDADQRKLYELIRRRAIACQLAAAEYSETVNHLQGRDGPDTFDYTAKGRVLVKAGFLQLSQGADEDDDDSDRKDDDGKVPALKAGTGLQADKGEILEKATKPPARFTEATLVKALEKEGIGRPSTYAAIISNIMARGYVETRKRLLYPTVKGRTLIRAIKGVFSFVELDYTRAVESRLDDIANGKDTYSAVVSGLYEKLNSEIEGTGIKPRASAAPSTKQIAFAQSVADQAGIPLPAEALETGRALSAFIDKHAVPTPKALEFAKSISERLGVALPAGADASAAIVRAFIDKHVGEIKKPGGAAKSAGDGSRARKASGPAKKRSAPRARAARA